VRLVMSRIIGLSMIGVPLLFIFMVAIYFEIEKNGLWKTLQDIGIVILFFGWVLTAIILIG
jgi:hypothetical protein